MIKYKKATQLEFRAAWINFDPDSKNEIDEWIKSSKAGKNIKFPTGEILELIPNLVGLAGIKDCEMKLRRIKNERRI